MSDTPTTTSRPARDPLEQPFGRSTVFDKLSPDHRRTLDQAIVDRDPPTFRGVYDKFHLADSGVSYYAFYRYARKLRARADRLHLTDLVLPDDTDLSDAMPRLIAQQLLDSMLSDETPAPEEVLRLTRAYRLATQTYLAKRRFAPPPTSQSEPERKRGASPASAKTQGGRRRRRSAGDRHMRRCRRAISCLADVQIRRLPCDAALTPDLRIGRMNCAPQPSVVWRSVPPFSCSADR
jgi:hypothetical protein